MTREELHRHIDNGLREGLVNFDWYLSWLSLRNYRNNGTPFTQDLALQVQARIDQEIDRQIEARRTMRGREITPDFVQRMADLYRTRWDWRKGMSLYADRKVLECELMIVRLNGASIVPC